MKTKNISSGRLNAALRDLRIEYRLVGALKPVLVQRIFTPIFDID